MLMILPWHVRNALLPVLLRSGTCQNLEYHFGGPYNKDYSIWVSFLASHYFGKLSRCCPIPATDLSLNQQKNGLSANQKAARRRMSGRYTGLRKSRETVVARKLDAAHVIRFTISCSSELAAAALTSSLQKSSKCRKKAVWAPVGRAIPQILHNIAKQATKCQAITFIMHQLKQRPELTHVVAYTLL